MITFGERVKQLRLDRSWSQQHLGDAIGVDDSHISRLETGKQKPTLKQVEKLACIEGNRDELYVLAGRIPPGEIYTTILLMLLRGEVIAPVKPDTICVPESLEKAEPTIELWSYTNPA